MSWILTAIDYGFPILQLIRIRGIALGCPANESARVMDGRFNHRIEIGNGGRVLIEAVRRVAAGHDACRLTLSEFAIAFPGDGLEVLATLRVFLQAIAHAGRRKLRVAPPGSTRLLPDEKLLLALIAAAQSGEQSLLDGYMCWLTRADRRMSLVSIAVEALATALGAHGLWLATPPERLGRDLSLSGISPPAAH
jgi:hypothetical protein